MTTSTRGNGFATIVKRGQTRRTTAGAAGGNGSLMVGDTIAASVAASAIARKPTSKSAKAAPPADLPLAILRIDVDADARLLTLSELHGRLRRAGKRALWLLQERSRSLRGWHVTVRVSPPCCSLAELVALQAICGSDPYREANNLLRVQHVGRVSPFWQRAGCVSVFYDPTY